MRFSFGPLIQYDLEITKKEWNEHRIRRQKNIDSPSGIPNVMFYWPEKYGKRDHKQNVDQRNVEIFLNEYGQVPLLYKPTTKELVEILIPDVSVPCTSEEAYNLFVKLTNLIRLNHLADET